MWLVKVVQLDMRDAFDIDRWGHLCGPQKLLSYYYCLTKILE